MRLPHTWYPKARAFKRDFVYHMGPTNSGKTFAALAALKAAKTGVYCAPLRLLAGEVADKLNAEGIKCSMITGQERILVEGATHIACTIEMLDLHQYYDCAVIDEIQMVEDASRGSGWTSAILGVVAPEVHLTGDFRASEIMKKLLDNTGDELRFETYSRLSPLNIVPPVENIENLKEGDCIITFSRRTCHQLMKLIQFKRPGTCSIIYGSLPPEARREQARKFNEREGAKFLLATDAIGMGLNYNINRIIFYSTEKSDGNEFRQLRPHEIKQIAGRAGRYNRVGQVTTTNSEDLGCIQAALNTNQIAYIQKAAIFPSFEYLMEFKQVLEEEHGALPYTEVLKRFLSVALLDQKYFIQSIDEICLIAEAIKDLPMCTLDTYIFSKAPVPSRFPGCLKALKMFASVFAMGDEVKLSLPKFSSKDELERQECEYSIYDLYIWLSFRFPNFTERDLARLKVEENAKVINEILETRALTSLKKKRSYQTKRKQKFRRLVV